jgi:Ni/Co efflux regulator RcnB
MRYSAGLMFLCGVLLAAAPSLSFAGKGKHEHEREYERGYERDSDGDHRHYRGKRHGEYFGDRHRVVVREYYVQHYGGRRCPPGLAKRHNGCVPPGHAKQWELGRPLPPEVVRYEVPAPLVVQLGRPDPGYRYVRIAGDILLIAAGTGMVVDAIGDLGGMR